MPLWKIAWRSIQRRGLASGLTAFSMALGVMLVVAVLLLHGVVAESFRNNASLGYNLILGPKGGRLQLVLNTVFYLSEPVENVPYSFYTQFLPADKHPEKIDGKWAPYIKRVIPVCLGDYYKQYRVVGTTHEMFDNYVFDEDAGKKYEFAEGRNFEYFNEEHGFFEAVVGAKVARDTNLKLGDTISANHGAPTGKTHEDRFVIVGILATTGTPNDRAVFVNMEGFYLLDDHAKPVAKKTDTEPTDETPADATADNTADGTSNEESTTEPIDGDSDTSGTDGAADGDTESGVNSDAPGTDESSRAAATQTWTVASVSVESDAGDHEHEAPPSYLAKRTPLPLEQREVTALLVRAPVRAARGLSNTINEGNVAQAVFPVGEITTLFNRIVKPLQQLLLVLTATICVVSGVSILVSIYNSMSDRRREIAIMRSLGAGRRTVMAVVLLEAVILALGGGLLGWVGGHLLVSVAAPVIESETGVTIGLFDAAPPVNLMEYIQPDSMQEINISTEWILVPSLVLLAILVGLLPALSAYRTDVADALTSNP